MSVGEGGREGGRVVKGLGESEREGSEGTGNLIQTGLNTVDYPERERSSKVGGFRSSIPPRLLPISLYTTSTFSITEPYLRYLLRPNRSNVTHPTHSRGSTLLRPIDV